MKPIWTKNFKKGYTNIGNLQKLPENSSIKIAAIISTIRKITTKKDGRPMAFAKLEDLTGSIEAVILLNEKITSIHLISFILVAAGLVIANLKK